MVDNVGRKITFVAIVLAVALGFLLFKPEPFRLGLDLQGGTRLTYRIPFDEAVALGAISQVEAQDPNLLLAQTVSIIRNRVDPQGLLEAVIRQEGEDRIAIELPGAPEVRGVQASASLESAVGPADRTIRIAAPAAELEKFPPTGGIVRIGDEKIRYESREGGVLRVPIEPGRGRVRGYLGTEPSAHEAGATVSLESDDAIRSIIENLGELSFRIVAETGDLQEAGTDLSSERARLEDWLAETPGAPIVSFNAVPREEGGPIDRIQWYPSKESGEPLPLLVQEDEDWVFTGSHLARVFPDQDRQGFPAVGFEFRPERSGAFAAFTDEYLNRRMAIVLNDEVESAPVIQSRLPGGGIIQGRYTDQEVSELLTVLRSGSLRIKPQLLNEEVVGPTLGADYVRRGFRSALIGLGAVLVFMVLYYRRLGVFSAISLVIALTILMGGLAFLQATLTLPGIAGIVLTIGMAVDANILIFDRIREELDKGMNVRQAARSGFEKAFSAIFDSNVTTLLAALILYHVGTGPVRGFAVTLSIGIVGSMIAALVVTRLFVHFALERGVKSFQIGTWFVTAAFDFLTRRKRIVAGAVSTVLVVGGLALFVATPANQKLGIDFLGGAEVLFRTEEPQPVDDVRSRVAAIPGHIGESAEVKPVAQSRVDGGYREFRVVFKVEEASPGAEEERALEVSIREALRDVLQKGPVEVERVETEDRTVSRWNLNLYFERPHASEDVAAALERADLVDPEVSAAPESPTRLTAVATGVRGRTVEQVRLAVQDAFADAEDSAGAAMDLANPIPSSSLVGPQVVGELRDKAILAVALSLFVTVLYLRVRFAEYSYGIAAVAAVTHDVIVALGILTLVNRLGWISAEINLPMVAAFLTIIGYSLNDTIVIFDRVRENLPRMKLPLRDVLNHSINQTLSRTILTSGTTMAAILVLFTFFLGTGNVLEGFAFAMMIGIVVGTYSTIYVANPVLLFLETRAARKRELDRAERRARKDETARAPTKA